MLPPKTLMNMSSRVSDELATKPGQIISISVGASIGTYTLPAHFHGHLLKIRIMTIPIKNNLHVTSFSLPYLYATSPRGLCDRALSHIDTLSIRSRGREGRCTPHAICGWSKLISGIGPHRRMARPPGRLSDEQAGADALFAAARTGIRMFDGFLSRMATGSPMGARSDIPLPSSGRFDAEARQRLHSFC